MKFMKSLGVLALSAIALLVLASSASATTLTSPSGTTLGVGAEAKASSVGEVILDGTVNVKCKKSTGEGPIQNAGGASTTVKFHIWIFVWSECGANTVVFVAHGTLIFHWIKPHLALVTWGGGYRITVLTHNILGTIHCIYVPNESELGTFKGSSETGSTATLEINSVPVPRESTDFGCGSTSELTGEYTFTSPDYLDVDS